MFLCRNSRSNKDFSISSFPCFSCTGTRPKLQAKRMGASSDFEMSADGKIMIGGDNTDEQNDKGEQPLDIGQKEVLGGINFKLIYIHI